MLSETITTLTQARRERRAAMVISDLNGGYQEILLEGEAVTRSDIAGEVAVRFGSGKSGVVKIGDREFFFNVHMPAPRLVIIGAVHISQALASISHLAGFDTVVIDPRSAFAAPERFPGATIHAEWPEEVLLKTPLDAHTAMAVLAHDPKIDDFPLIEALHRKCFYVGALGSRKTHAKRVDRLMAAGVVAEDIARIHAPIGLDIAAANPAEIAVAVMAEVIDALRKRNADVV